MRKSLVLTLCLLAILCLSGSALAQEPAATAPQDAADIARAIFAPAAGDLSDAGLTPAPELRTHQDCTIFSGACLRFLCECSNVCEPCGVQSSTCFPTRTCTCQTC